MNLQFFWKPQLKPFFI
uniref:Uncharacterized protein n=1 Tax=Arundo donax TaxID=35708 RepID=A0A0A8YSB5_ARUDO